MTKRAPVNTAKEASENPILPLAEAMIFGAGRSIERQEAEGQKSFVKSETLPTNMGRGGDYDTKTILEAAGLKFLGVVDGDPMFQYVELPKGWQKRPTDHSMWSHLVDDKGRIRGSIFYKAAFYDRDSHMHLNHRFGVNKDYERQEKEAVAVANATDGDKVIFTTDPVKLSDDRHAAYELGDVAIRAAAAWLDQHYPDWKNPGAYWD